MHAGAIVCTSILLLVAVATSVAAQTASLVARVTDPDRAAVEGAPVILTNAQSGAQQTSLTSNDGTARFTGLVPGEYRLEVAARNFKVHAETIALAAGERTVEARLEIAPFQEDVTVQGVATVPTIGRVNMPLRDQPLTVNTLTSEFLANYAVNDVVTALKYVPNVTAYSQYGVYQYFTFRGFSDSLQLVDGIRNEGNRVNTQLANVERLEVLKGPASVLYGGDAVGATVNLVLKKPSPDPAYDFSATAGSWDTYRGAFGAAGRVGSMEQVFYRFDIAGDAADNFRHDPSDRFNVTPSITWRLPGRPSSISATATIATGPAATAASRWCRSPQGSLPIPSARPSATRCPARCKVTEATSFPTCPATAGTTRPRTSHSAPTTTLA